MAKEEWEKASSPSISSKTDGDAFTIEIEGQQYRDSGTAGDLQPKIGVSFGYADELARHIERQQEIVKALDLAKNKAPNQFDAEFPRRNDRRAPGKGPGEIRQMPHASWCRSVGPAAITCQVFARSALWRFYLSRWLEKC